MKTFALKIISKTEVILDTLAVSLVVPTNDGYIGIMANRSNAVIALSEGMMKYTLQDGEIKKIKIKSGIMEFKDNSANIACKVI